MVMKQYGPVAIVTYLGVYVTTLGGIFAGITYGIDPAAYGMDPEYLVKKVRRSQVFCPVMVRRIQVKWRLSDWR